MDQTELKEFVVSSFKQNLIPIALFCIGLLFLSYGLISLFHSNKDEGEIVFEPAKKEQLTVESKNEKTIIVDIEGAVIKPGVYVLNSSSRLQDALIKAGGFSDKADRKEIALNMNLASQLTDGSKIYIPFIGEKAVLGADLGNTSGSS